MELEFINILNGIESSNYDPEIKGKLQMATMLLWQLRDLENGGTGIVSWNGMQTSPIDLPITPKAEEPKAEEPKAEEPKAEEPIKKQRKPKKPTVNLEKDLGINLDKLNLDDILIGF